MDASCYMPSTLTRSFYLGASQWGKSTDHMPLTPSHTDYFGLYHWGKSTDFNRIVQTLVDAKQCLG